MRRRKALFAAVATAAVVLSGVPAAVPAASASSDGQAETLADGLVGPLHISSGDRGIIVSEEFAGRLTLVGPDGAKKSIYSAPEWDVAGNAQHRSTVYVVESQGAGPEDPRPLAGHLRIIDKDGRQRTVGDFAALETNHNPDGDSRYGFEDLPAPCAAQLPPEVPAAYRGEVDSHPYGITVAGRTAYVADAGANSIVSVDVETGKMKTVAVLPAMPFKVTAAAAAAHQLPECVVGRHYSFEPVPTDVALGSNGKLYVTVLPGGPEDPSLGARGAVFTVDPDGGKVKLLAEKIMSPTGLAIDGDGNLFLASLFGEGVLKIDGRSGKQSVILNAALSADVALNGNRLFATVDALPAEGENAAPEHGRAVTIKISNGSDDRGDDKRDRDDDDDD